MKPLTIIDTVRMLPDATACASALADSSMYMPQPADWTSASLKGKEDTYTLQLTEADAAELIHAVDRLKARGVASEDDIKQVCLHSRHHVTSIVLWTSSSTLLTPTSLHPTRRMVQQRLLREPPCICPVPSLSAVSDCCH